MAGAFTRAPALVPWSSPSQSLSITRDATGRPTGARSETAQSFIDQFMARWPRNLNPVPPPTSGRCSREVPFAWPDGTPATLFCSLDPDHDGDHQPHDTAGNVMPLPVDAR